MSKGVFHKVRRNDVLKILKTKRMGNNIIELIKKTNGNNTAKIVMKAGVTNTIALRGGIRQGVTLRPTLLNMIMNQILKDVKRQEGYMMGNKVNIICYAKYVVMMADNILQRQLETFYKKQRNTCPQTHTNTENQILKGKVTRPVTKASKVNECIRETIWENRKLKSFRGKS